MTPLYAERAVGRRRWWILLALCLLGAVAVFFAAGGPHDWTVLILVGLLELMVGGPAALMLWSRNFYGRLVVTSERIVVGRERIRVADVWPRTFLEAAVPGERTTPRGGRVAGGAFDVPLGSATATISVKGLPVQIATVRPEEFLAALRLAAEQTPVRP